MGVPGLWEILQEAGHSRSLVNIAVVDGFERNNSGVRGTRVGIDASLWYFHAENSTDAGSNPELRLLAFRCFKLLTYGVIPLFVFDGRERPELKRGSRMGKRGSHWLSKDFKQMLDCFGMEWRVAPAEAEAELAYLNKLGFIEAVITDDGDAFLFGARTVIRNMSFSLTGNKKNPAQDSQGKNSRYHVRIFEADAIESHRKVGLTRGGMILFALLCGGDYDNKKGVRGISPKVAHGLARLGFGDRLLAEYGHGSDHFKAYIPRWRAELTREIQTNTSGFLPGRKDITLPVTFPDPHIFELYANPITSARTSVNGTDGLAMRCRGNPSLPSIAEFCETKFDDWGGPKGVLKRLSSLLYGGAVIHLLRRAAQEADEKEKSKRSSRGESLKITGPLQSSPAEAVGTPASLVARYLKPVSQDRAANAFVNRRDPAPSATPLGDPHPLITRVTTTRNSVDTDFILEYRVSVDPAQLVELASSGFKSKHADPASQPMASQASAPAGSQSLAARAAAFDLTAPLRIWVPASMLRQVHPQLIADFEARKNKPKGVRITGKGKQRAVPVDDEDDDDEEDDDILDLTSSPARPAASQRTKKPARASPAKRVAASSPVRPTPAKRGAVTASVLPVPAEQPPSTPKRVEPEPPAAPVQPSAHIPEVRVKQERAAAGQPFQTPSRPFSTITQPIASSTSRLAHAGPQPPPLPAYFPPPPRVFFNVGLIETEEPLSDRAFVFTFTDPDDPAYVFMDEAGWYNEDEMEVDRIAEHAIAFNSQPQNLPRSQPADGIGPPSTSRNTPPARRSRNPVMPPVLEPVEELWEQWPEEVQPRAGPSAAAAPVVVPPPLVPPQRPTPSARRSTAASQPAENRHDDIDVFGDPAGMGRYDQMFDQILGIVPGAQKKKPMTAAARKRLLASIEAGASSSQPAKRRRTATSKAASSVAQPPAPRGPPRASTSRVSPSVPVSTSHSPPAVPPHTSRTDAVAAGSASQPNRARQIADFPDLPPLMVPASQPTRPAARSRPVTRLGTIVVVSSDEEDGAAAPTTAKHASTSTQTNLSRPAASQPPSYHTRADAFLADADRVVRLF
ncbi:hypothetical protein BC835DRAFT_1325469 [Cytidiella melzeri]|nr:hypothetical protein BC835DRAFT_1325469 [Cytidiella melzeri]